MFMNFKQLNESFDRMFNNLLTEDTYDNFDDFYQAVWGSFLDRYSDENDYIIDQSTQGSRGSTFIVDKADGVAYEIDEREALESIQEIYSNSGTIEDGIETLDDIKQLNHSYNWDDTDAEEDEEDIKTSPSQVREFVSKLSDIYISKSFYDEQLRWYTLLTLEGLSFKLTLNGINQKELILDMQYMNNNLNSKHIATNILINNQLLSSNYTFALVDEPDNSGWMIYYKVSDKVYSFSSKEFLSK